MRLLLISILSFLTFLVGNCQSKVIPKTYNYFSKNENWTLRIFDYKIFELLVGTVYGDSRFVLEGNCIMTDSTFQFQFTPSVNLDYIKRDTTLFKLNVKEFINGKTFSIIEDYLIPKLFKKQEDYKVNKSYYQQVELNMGGTKIDLFGKKNYTLTEYTCKGKWIEKGYYTLKEKFIVLTPSRKSHKLSARLMDKNVAIFTDDFLVTKKIEQSLQPDFFLQEENFVYYIRM